MSLLIPHVKQWHMSVDGGSPGDLGWQIDVDDEAEELQLEHPASGSVYRLDAEGGLRVVGGGPDEVEAAGEALEELQSTLAAALDADQQRSDASAASESAQSTCQVECNQRGEVVIESDTKISLAAPNIEISADAQLTTTSSGILTLQGSLVKIN
jgi:hypothetical protein